MLQMELDAEHFGQVFVLQQSHLLHTLGQCGAEGVSDKPEILKGEPHESRG